MSSSSYEKIRCTYFGPKTFRGCWTYIHYIAWTIFLVTWGVIISYRHPKCAKWRVEADRVLVRLMKQKKKKLLVDSNSCLGSKHKEPSTIGH